MEHSLTVQANSDAHCVSLWLANQTSVHTERSYRLAAEQFVAMVAKPLKLVTVGDLQRYVETLAATVSPASAATRIAAIKALFGFAHRIGYLGLNVAAVIASPKVKDTLSERIMPVADVQALLQAAETGRDAALLTLVYRVGLRNSEAAALSWRDAMSHSSGGANVTVFGKGGKTRVVFVPQSVWQMVAALRGGAADDQPIFASRKSGHLDTSAIHRIIKGAVERAGLSEAISLHWLRHAHVSHSLDNGAPVHLVQATVGHASLDTTTRYAHVRSNTSSASYLGD